MLQEIFTTIQQLQIIQEDILMLEHDVPLDYIPTRNCIQLLDKQYTKPDKIQ